MQITSATPAREIAELMGPPADEIDGRIMLELLMERSESGGPLVETDEMKPSEWQALVEQAREVRRRRDAGIDEP